MYDLNQDLEKRVRDALAFLGADYVTWDPQLRDATRPGFGHLQSNLPLRLAKPLGSAPMSVGQALLDVLDVEDICQEPTLTAPGFLNFTWRTEVLTDQVASMLGDPHLGSVPASPGERVVLDYSSPNVAKQMHVGHLRSTVIGDALGRILTFQGHDVVRQNHLGDWGTQFGMLIEEILFQGDDTSLLDLGSLDTLYRKARSHFESDAAFATLSRERVVLLQSGDEITLELWASLVSVSMGAFQEMYSRMGSLLSPEDVAGESFYNTFLPGMVEDLAQKGLLVSSDGALCVFLPGFVSRDDQPLPIIVQKADGGFGYDATDLAALRYRVEALDADRLVYVVDARQSLHFEQVFALGRAAGYLPKAVTAQHVAFGTVLGSDGKPFKTRSGGTVSLASLLDAAETKAAQLLKDRNSSLTAEDKEALARSIGVGAVKYSDLSNALGRDYVFDVDKMVALEGNTGPYLQYAHARLSSLLARAGGTDRSITVLAHPAEEKLALLLTRFAQTVEMTGSALEPHKLCTYLYEVASTLSVFYESCPVLTSESDTLTSRLGLCQVTQQVLGVGLNLLGIDAPQRM